MPKNLVFDTLEYANLLAKGGVEYSDIHSASLATVITQNIYTKNEVDKMFEAALKRFDERTQEFRERTQEFREEANRELREMDKHYAKTLVEHKLEMKELANRIDRAFNRSMYATISILGALIVIVGAVSTFAHYFLK